MKKERGLFKTIWNFLWHSNSIWSWIIDFLIAFIIIKFIFFPLLSLAFSASLPMVIVESRSMVHNGDFNEWWDSYGEWYIQNGIAKEQFQIWEFKNGINKGDIIIVFGKDRYEKGEVIIFRVANQKTPIIHRIVSDGDFYSTKGDNNQYQLSTEKIIMKQQIIGKAVARIPALGWIKLIAFNPLGAFSD